MAFKLKSGNKPAFKQMGAMGLEPLQESPYMQTTEKPRILESGENVGKLEGYTWSPGENAYILDSSLVDPVKVNPPPTSSNNGGGKTSINISNKIAEDTNVTKTQYVDGKLRKKTITYTNPKSMPGVQKISQKQKPGRDIVKTKIKYTDSKTGEQYITKQKKKRGGEVKEKGRKKGSILSIQDKEKISKLFKRKK